MRHYGHNHMGIYAEIVRGGTMGIGDSLRVD
jgi:hypothetical protein